MTLDAFFDATCKVNLLTFIKGRRQKVLLGDGKGFGPRILLISQKISFQIFET